MTVELSRLHFHRDDWGQLLVQCEGLPEPVIVEPVRAFPLTHPQEHISLLDRQGKEICRIPWLPDLPDDQRQILEEELQQREFSPVILRILQAGPTLPGNWEVETDRGVTRFDLDSEDDFRKLSDGTVIIADTNGIRYRIPKVEQLDAGSRAILRRFL